MTALQRPEVFDQIGEGMDYRRIYWLNGPNVKGNALTWAVKDPPTSGWQSAIVIRGEKRSTIFCPFSINSWTVPNHCAELTSAKHQAWDLDWFTKAMPRIWAENQKFGYQKDYDTAAMILKRLGLPVPEQVMRDGAVDTRVKGGKTVAVKLEKPVKLKGKRGQFLKWFLDGGGTRSIREAMAEHGMTRSNALSYLYMIQKDHGIGYELVGDMAHIKMPEGVTNPFDEPYGAEPEPAMAEPASEEVDDDFLDS